LLVSFGIKEDFDSAATRQPVDRWMQCTLQKAFKPQWHCRFPAWKRSVNPSVVAATECLPAGSRLLLVRNIPLYDHDLSKKRTSLKRFGFKQFYYYISV
jgi:hypothetical protein